MRANIKKDVSYLKSASELFVANWSDLKYLQRKPITTHVAEDPAMDARRAFQELLDVHSGTVWVFVWFDEENR